MVNFVFSNQSFKQYCFKTSDLGLITFAVYKQLFLEEYFFVFLSENFLVDDAYDVTSPPAKAEDPRISSRISAVLSALRLHVRVFGVFVYS